MRTPKLFRHMKIAVIWLFAVLVFATFGYMHLEQLSFLDALYTTIVIITTVGTPIRPLTEGGRALTIGVVISGLGVLLYTLGVTIEAVIEGHLSRAFRRYLMDRRIMALHNHYIICGFGRVGSRIAEEFAFAHIPFVIIDDNEQNVQICLKHDYLALQGDATRDTTLCEAGLEQAKGLLVATDNDAHNTFITLSARHLKHDLLIVARANREETEAKLKHAGADHVLSPYTLAGHRMANIALQRGVIEFFDLLTQTERVELALQEIRIAPTSPLLGKTLSAIQHIVDSGIILVAVKKPNELVTIAQHQARIEQGDTLIVVGRPAQLAKFSRKHAQNP